MMRDRLVGGVLVLTIVMLVVFLIVSMLGLGAARSPSPYTGVVTDMEVDKGLVFRTTQVRLKTSPESSNFEEFCIPPGREDELVPQFRELVNNQTRVTVTYSRPRFVGVWDCNPKLAMVKDVVKVS